MVFIKIMCFGANSGSLPRMLRFVFLGVWFLFWLRWFACPDVEFAIGLRMFTMTRTFLPYVPASDINLDSQVFVGDLQRTQHDNEHVNVVTFRMWFPSWCSNIIGPFEAAVASRVLLAFLRIVQMSRSAQVLHELMLTEGRLKSL